VHVRDATTDDTASLCRLWKDLLASTEEAHEPPEAVAARSVTRAEADPSCRIVVAEQDGEVVGCAYLRTAAASPVHDERLLHVSHLQTDHKHRTVAEHAVIEAAVRWAEQHGMETLVASTSAYDRDVNRSLARLGLAQAAVLRTASVAALRALLPPDPATAARGTARPSRSVGQVVAARRSQRRARTRHLLT
jgi:L-amino acid N-acyltransferase YncA